MSGWRVPTHPNRRAARIVAAFVVLCGAALGLLAAAGGAVAQPQKTKLEDIGKASAADPDSPLTADGRRAKTHANYAIDTDRLIFSKIEDFQEVAPEDKNSLEYEAWCEVVMHAKRFSTAELEHHGIRDLTVFDLIKPVRVAFRCELVRFEGKLVCVRRLPVPKFFAENPKSGIKEMFEARFVPIDESPLTPVSIVFLELPEALKAVAGKPHKEWVDFDAWISAAGYYFKTMNVPGDEGKTVGVPVLVGKSVSPLAGPPVPSGDPTALEPDARIYKFIREDTKMIRPDTPWEEVASYNRVLIHAARFTPEELEAHARTDVKFADLFEPVRADFKLKNVKLEGRLISLRRMEANNELRAAGVNTVFEGWLVPATEPRGNPVCIVFSEPLEGVEATGRVNAWVTFAGYSFKRMRYESAEQDAKNPAKNVDKYAPLLIGKRPILRPDPSAARPLSWSLFVQVTIGIVVLLVGAAAVLTWWYRGGDRRSKAAVEAARGRNPFDATAPPAT